MLKVGVVGCDGMGIWHLKKYNELPNVKIEDLDAVSIVLPNFLHMPVTLEFLSSGKDVLCEKSMARTYAESEKMVKKAKEKKRVLMVNMNHRWRPENSTLKELAAGGRFGEIYYLRARCLRNETFNEEQKKTSGLRTRRLPGKNPGSDIPLDKKEKEVILK